MFPFWLRVLDLNQRVQVSKTCALADLANPQHSSFIFDILPRCSHRRILLQRGCWLTQSYVSQQWTMPRPHYMLNGSGRISQLGQPKPFDVDSSIGISV